MSYDEVKQIATAITIFLSINARWIFLRLIVPILPEPICKNILTVDFNKSNIDNPLKRARECCGHERKKRNLEIIFGDKPWGIKLKTLNTSCIEGFLGVNYPLE